MKRRPQLTIHPSRVGTQLALVAFVTVLAMGCETTELVPAPSEWVSPQESSGNGWWLIEVRDAQQATQIGLTQVGRNLSHVIVDAAVSAGGDGCQIPYFQGLRASDVNRVVALIGRSSKPGSMPNGRCLSFAPPVIFRVAIETRPSAFELELLDLPCSYCGALTLSIEPS